MILSKLVWFGKVLGELREGSPRDYVWNFDYGGLLKASRLQAHRWKWSG